MKISCDGCGKCCQHMGMPPFLEYELSCLPTGLREELEFIKLINPKHDDGGTPCIWLGEDKKCKHYQYRPHVCDDFKVGCKSCLLYRLSK